MLSTTPLRYELLRNTTGTYAILDHQLDVWLTTANYVNTWGSLYELLTAPYRNYSFEYDYESSSAKPYSREAYLSLVAQASHIHSLGYFSDLESFVLDYPEYLI